MGDIMNKVYGIEKASLLKRFSAYLLDAILTIIVATGVLFVASHIVGYNEKSQIMDELYEEYEEKYGISFELTQEEYDKLTEEEKQNYEEAYEAFSQDEEVIYAYNLVFNLSLALITVGLLVGIAVVEFVIPLCLKNGQTVGKKIFGLCLVKSDSVKINNMMLFIRAFLGKFTIETMIPVYILLLIIFGNAGMIGTAVLFLVLIIQIILSFATTNKTLIHDLMAGTVVVDMSSQMIFESEEKMLEFKKDFYKKEAENKKYF